MLPHTTTMLEEFAIISEGTKIPEDHHCGVLEPQDYNKFVVIQLSSNSVCQLGWQCKNRGDYYHHSCAAMILKVPRTYFCECGENPRRKRLYVADTLITDYVECPSCVKDCH